jgi:hypothetical protein
VAAPMPRCGSVWLDAVCLVPNRTNCWMVALIRLGSTRCSSCHRAGSTLGASSAKPSPAGAAYAGEADEAIGAATAAAAVTAVAEMNARRLGPEARNVWVFSEKWLFSILRTKNCYPSLSRARRRLRVPSEPARPHRSRSKQPHVIMAHDVVGAGLALPANATGRVAAI